MYKVKDIQEALKPFDPEMPVRPRHHPAMSDIEGEHVEARIVSYVELTFFYQLPVSRPRKK